MRAGESHSRRKRAPAHLDREGEKDSNHEGQPTLAVLALQWLQWDPQIGKYPQSAVVCVIESFRRLFQPPSSHQSDVLAKDPIFFGIGGDQNLPTIGSINDTSRSRSLESEGEENNEKKTCDLWESPEDIAKIVTKAIIFHCHPGADRILHDLRHDLKLNISYLRQRHEKCFPISEPCNEEASCQRHTSVTTTRFHLFKNFSSHTPTPIDPITISSSKFVIQRLNILNNLQIIQSELHNHYPTNVPLPASSARRPYFLLDLSSSRNLIKSAFQEMERLPKLDVLYPLVFATPMQEYPEYGPAPFLSSSFLDAPELDFLHLLFTCILYRLATSHSSVGWVPVHRIMLARIITQIHRSLQTLERDIITDSDEAETHAYSSKMDDLGKALASHTGVGVSACLECVHYADSMAGARERGKPDEVTPSRVRLSKSTAVRIQMALLHRLDPGHFHVYDHPTYHRNAHSCTNENDKDAMELVIHLCCRLCEPSIKLRSLIRSHKQKIKSVWGLSAYDELSSILQRAADIEVDLPIWIRCTVSKSNRISTTPTRLRHRPLDGSSSSSGGAKSAWSIKTSGSYDTSRKDEYYDNLQPRTAFDGQEENFHHLLASERIRNPIGSWGDPMKIRELKRIILSGESMTTFGAPTHLTDFLQSQKHIK